VASRLLDILLGGSLRDLTALPLRLLERSLPFGLPSLPGLSALPALPTPPRAAAHLLLRLPEPIAARIRGEPVVVLGRALDPQVHLLLRLMEVFRQPGLTEKPVDAARRDFRRNAAILAPDAPAVEREDRTVQGAAGPLAARLYRPPGMRAPAPLLVYFHGGGFVLGDLESHDGLCAALAERARGLVLAVDYRLAPEHPFPAAADDAAAAFRHAVERASDLGADPERVAVGGDSAGANLAAVVALDAAAAGPGAPRPALQVLAYPGVDSSRDAPSFETFARGFMLERDDIHWFRRHYVGLDPATRRQPRASPLLAPSLAGAPPAHVHVAGFDVLHDEGIAYALRLREAGVPVVATRHDGLIHGFLSLAGAVDAAGRALDAVADGIRRTLHA